MANKSIKKQKAKHKKYFWKIEIEICLYSAQIQRSQGSNLDWMSFDLEPPTRQHVKRMAPNQKKKPTKKTKKIAAIKTVKKEEQVEELKESLEEHVQDDGAHQIEEQLEQLKESLEEHVEDGGAHHFEEKWEERVEKKHEKLDKMEEGEESLSLSSKESEDEDDEGSTSSSSSDEEDGWLRGKLSGLFGSRTHFGSANPRQVQVQGLFAEFFSSSPGAGGQWERRLQQRG